MSQSPFLGVYRTKDGQLVDMISGQTVTSDEIAPNMSPFYGVFVDKNGNEHSVFELGTADGEVTRQYVDGQDTAVATNAKEYTDTAVIKLDAKLTEVDTQLDNLAAQSTAKWVILNETETRSKNNTLNKADKVDIDTRFGSVDNTADVSKPLSFIQQSYIDQQDALLQSRVEKGVNGGYAPLDENGFVPAEHVPINNREPFVFNVLQSALAWLAVPENLAKVIPGDDFFFTDFETNDYWWSGTALAERKSSTNLSNYYSVNQTDLLLTNKATKLQIPQNNLPRRSAAGVGEPDSAMEYSPLPQASTLARRTGTGTLKAASPVELDDVVNKRYADTLAVDSIVETIQRLPFWSRSDTKPNYTKEEVGLGNVPNLDTTQAITHTLRIDNPHGVTKNQIGLSNADNTADIAKNVLSAAKLTTPRTINGIAFDGSVDIVLPTNSLFMVSGPLSTVTLTTTPTEMLLPTQNRQTRGSDISLDTNLNRFVFMKDGFVRITRRINFTGGTTRIIKYDVRKNGQLNTVGDTLDSQTRFVGNNTALMYIESVFIVPVYALDKYSVYASVTTSTQSIAYTNCTVTAEYM